jgi:putative transcriptional regulator
MRRCRALGALGDQTVDVWKPGTSTRGRLLVATPPLVDPNFDRSVLYMLDHGESGAVGVILNRPWSDVGDADDGAEFDAFEALDTLDDWRSLLSPPARVFLGGPVADDSLIALAVAVGRREDAWGPVTDTIGTVDLSLSPAEVANEVHRVRIFRGYSGWSPGQLDAELMEGAWMVLGAVDTDVFTRSPDDLWRTVLRRQGGRLAWIAEAPDDISAN